MLAFTVTLSMLEGEHRLRQRIGYHEFADIDHSLVFRCHIRLSIDRLRHNETYSYSSVSFSLSVFYRLLSSSGFC